MSIVDLKGNTNFVAFKNLQDEYIVPRTNLAAIDMDVANGLAVAGSTIYANLATADDIATGTTGHLVDAVGLHDALSTKIDDTYASVAEIMVASPELPISNKELHGALSTGKAVDVTSQPNASIGTLSYETDYRGTITYAGAAGTAKIGFYDNSTKFPKFATGLVYILMADVTNSGSAAITLSFGGTDLNGSAGELAVGASKRVAILFSSATTGYFSFTATATSALEITNLREFEVTGCSDEARKYIANLSNPDDFTKFYLVDYDEQNPWTYIIDMETSPAVTLMAGLSYKLDATTGTHTITTDICPVGYNGEDAHLTLFVGLGSNIVFQAPLNLIDPLTPGAGHNITVKFRDGQANAYVDDTDIGYIITVNGGTDSGSLYYGLTTATEDYLVFANGTDGTPIELSGVTASQGEKTVVGNGYDKTTVTGSATFSSKTVFSNLTMSGVVADITEGAALTLGDVAVDTLTVTSGFITLDNVTGTGSGLIDLGGNKRCFVSRAADISNVTITGGTSTHGGGIQTANSAFTHQLTDVVIKKCGASKGAGIYVGSSGYFNMSDCLITSNHSLMSAGGIDAMAKSILNINGSTIASNISDVVCGGVLVIGSCTIDSSVVTDNFASNSGGGVACNGGANSATVRISASTISNNNCANYGGGIYITGAIAAGYISSSVVANNSGYRCGGVMTTAGAKSYISNTEILNNSAGVYGGGCVFYHSGSAGTLGELTSVRISGNTAGSSAGGLYMNSANCTITDSVISGNIANNSVSDIYMISASTVGFAGSNVIGYGYGDATCSAIVSSGATLDLTGNTNTVPMDISGGVAIDGGMTVLYDHDAENTQLAESAAYEITGMTFTVPQIGNTNVVNLNNSNVVISSGGTAYASGCTFTGGSTGYGGAFYVSKGGGLNLDGCLVVSSPAGKGQIYSLDTINLKDTVVSNALNNFDVYMTSATGVANINGGCKLGKCRVDYGGIFAFAGSNTVDEVKFFNVSSGRSGSVNISSGASINLTSSITPGGGIVVDGGCTVNGASISEGTYTAITSVGGSASATV